MKGKVWSAVTVFVLAALVSSTALAGVEQGGRFGENPGAAIREQAQIFKEHAGEIAAAAREIRDYRLEINRLRNEMITMIQEMRRQLRALAEEERPVDEELAAQIREYLQVIREERLELGQTLGSLQGFSRQVRSQRLAGNIGEIPHILQGVLEVQRERILSLAGIIEQLKQLLELLR